MNKHLFLGIHLILITLMAYLGVQGAYLKWNDDLDPAVQSDRPVPVENPDLTGQPGGKGKSLSGQGRHIVGRNLFNVLTEEEKAPAKQPERSVRTVKPPPDMALQLTLKGTVTGDTRLYAVMENKKQRKQNLYRPGESIDDAVLKAVFKNHVILEKNGQQFQIDMDEEESGSGRSTARNPSPRKERRMEASNAPPAPPEPGDSMMPDEDDESEIPGIEDLRRQIKSRPHTSNGEQDGILVYGIRPKSMFRKIGLRNGDIVQQIDDTAVESTEDLLSAIQDAQEDAPINISILRGGQVRQVVYDVSGNDEN